MILAMAIGHFPERAQTSAMVKAVLQAQPCASAPAFAFRAQKLPKWLLSSLSWWW